MRSSQILAAAVCVVALVVGLGAGAVAAPGDSSAGKLKVTKTKLDRLSPPTVGATSVPALKVPKGTTGATGGDGTTTPTPDPGSGTSPPPGPPAPPPPPPPTTVDPDEQIF